MVLEIGCGWGGFVEYVVKIVGVNVCVLIILKEQYDYVCECIYKVGLNDKVDIVFQDYWDEIGVYDWIVLIEMFEVVGEKYWLIYFEKLFMCLKLGGKVGFQIIIIQDIMFEDYWCGIDFIQCYIFFGGMLLLLGKLVDIGKLFGFNFEEQIIFGQDYVCIFYEWWQWFWLVWL